MVIPEALPSCRSLRKACAAPVPLPTSLPTPFLGDTRAVAALSVHQGHQQMGVSPAGGQGKLLLRLQN